MKISLTAILRRIRWMVIPYLLILIICLVIKLTFTREEIFFAVNRHNYLFADLIAPYITDMGNGWTAIVLAAIMALFSYRKAFLIATAYGVTSIFAQIVKHIFDAPRPKLYFKDQLSKIHFVKGVDILSMHSFPSGHTVTAFSLAVLFACWCRNKAFGPVFLLAAILVGYSRMYLSEHFFEDVVTGSVIGFVVTVIWLYWIDNSKFIQRPGWQRGLLKN